VFLSTRRDHKSAPTAGPFDSPVCDRLTGHRTVAVCDKQVVVAGLISQRTPQKALSHQTVGC
jgi:hypothetical protein